MCVDVGMLAHVGAHARSDGRFDGTVTSIAIPIRGSCSDDDLHHALSNFLSGGKAHLAYVLHNVRPNCAPKTPPVFAPISAPDLAPKFAHSDPLG